MRLFTVPTMVPVVKPHPADLDSDTREHHEIRDRLAPPEHPHDAERD
jgi:hypothetical protein